MYQLTVQKKTGYKVLSLPIEILDNVNNPFYTALPNTVQFNLPPGDYMVKRGSFQELKSPVKYNLFKMPFPERFFYPNPFKFDIEFANNPHKCSILWEHGLIVFDNQYKDAPLPIKDFLFFHEIGHSKYSTEKYCDLYAANEMLKAGYNPSQIGLAPALTLSDKQDERVDYLINKILAA